MFPYFLFSEIQGKITILWEKRGKFLTTYTVKAYTLLLIMNCTISPKTEFVSLLFFSNLKITVLYYHPSPLLNPLSLHFLSSQELVELINSNRVLVVSGETGCGKTTQVTQFILDDYINRGMGSLCRVVCTQPRRISAISVCALLAFSGLTVLDCMLLLLFNVFVCVPSLR